MAHVNLTLVLPAPFTEAEVDGDSSIGLGFVEDVYWCCVADPRVVCRAGVEGYSVEVVDRFILFFFVFVFVLVLGLFQP